MNSDIIIRDVKLDILLYNRVKNDTWKIMDDLFKNCTVKSYSGALYHEHLFLTSSIGKYFAHIRIDKRTRYSSICLNGYSIYEIFGTYDSDNIRKNILHLTEFYLNNMVNNKANNIHIDEVRLADLNSDWLYKKDATLINKLEILDI